jgi:hypothetical protein
MRRLLSSVAVLAIFASPLACSSEDSRVTYRIAETKTGAVFFSSEVDLDKPAGTTGPQALLEPEHRAKIVAAVGLLEVEILENDVVRLRLSCVSKPNLTSGAGGDAVMSDHTTYGVNVHGEEASCEVRSKLDGYTPPPRGGHPMMTSPSLVT